MIHAYGETMPFLIQIFGQSFIHDFGEDVTELECSSSGFFKVLAVLVKVKDIAVQFQQFQSKQIGCCNAGMGIFLN